MTVQLLHVADLHCGGLADIRQLEALERMIPDLRPDAIVVAGDVAQRARHGELQRARAFVRRGSSSPLRARLFTILANFTSTNCMPFSVRSSRRGAAPMRAGRCSMKSGADWNYCLGSDLII